MKKKISPLFALLLAAFILFSGGLDIVFGGQDAVLSPVETVVASPAEWVQGDGTTLISADGTYTSKEDVALYIHTYGCLKTS